MGDLQQGTAKIEPDRPDEVTTADETYFDDRPDSVSDSGVHAMPDAAITPGVRFGHPVRCEACRGEGYVIMTTRDLLRESLGLIADGADVIVKEFYTRLFQGTPSLARIFPEDLLTGGEGTEGARQRDRLLQALVSLAKLYDPDDPEAMQRLTTALKAYGRSHANFDRRDGSMQGASFDEYGAVKSALLMTISDAVGDDWKDVYTKAWSEAYDFAAVMMLGEQYQTAADIATARQPRQSSRSPLRGATLRA